MKKQPSITSFLIAIVAFATLSFTVNKPKPANCMMAVTYSELAMIQFKKVGKTKTVEEAKPLIKKGMDQIQQASTYAVQCDCTLSETNALSAYVIAKKVYEKGTDLDQMKADVKKAMNLSIAAMSAAQKCNK